MSNVRPSDTGTARIGAIDVTRAVTMLMMIFVNDLWSVKNVPAWMEHVASGVDGMGLADTVFPAFLFIVGLSLPFALRARRQRGDSTMTQALHIVLRALGLVIMGVWMVNGESIDETATGVPRWAWTLSMCVGFILIWNQWPRTWPSLRTWAARALGAAILVALAWIYHGLEGSFGPQWWGILGIIGWAYLLAGLITVLARDNVVALVIAWAALAGLSMAAAAGILPGAVDPLPSPLRDGTHAGLIMGGVVTATLFDHFVRKSDNKALTLTFVLMSAGLLLAAQLTRPLWGLSKIDATPAWLFLTSAITLLLFLGLYWLTDVAGRRSWFAAIKPAGSDTLQTYLTPYFVYPAIGFLYFQLPDALTTGVVGLVKSLLFALLCIGVSGIASRWIKLKL